MTSSLHFKKLALSAAIAVSLTACGGDDGDDGSRGAQGPAGVGDVIIDLRQRGRYESGIFDEGAAEIVAYDSVNRRLFVVNADAAEVEVLDASDPDNLTRIGAIDATSLGDGANSVAVYNDPANPSNGLVAVAIEANPKQNNGVIGFYDATDLSLINSVTVGALPDMVTFTPDGNRVLVANEGEPNSDYSNDPEGSISVIDVSAGAASATVATVGFTGFNADKVDLINDGVRIFGGVTGYGVASYPATDQITLATGEGASFSAGDWLTLDDADSSEDNVPYQVLSVSTDTLTLTDALDGDSNTSSPGDDTVYRHDASSTVAQDLEPEYIAVSADGNTAWVSLQENNALAKLDLSDADINNAVVTDILPLGYKDHSIPGNELDGSNDDDRINLQTWPLLGMYMPDSIASFRFNDQDFIITANEGDSREYDAFNEETEVGDIRLDGGLDPDLQTDEAINPLAITQAEGRNGDVDYEQLYSYGARSFSVWNADGELVFDSGSDFARIIANRFPENFNASNDDNDLDDRSDNKGSEPEAITVGTISGRTFAFFGLERQGGIMVYDVSNPYNPAFIQYLTNRDFSVDIDDLDNGILPAGAAGDLGPEGFAFISAENSPTGNPMLAVGNEVSGTTTLYEISVLELPAIN